MLGLSSRVGQCLCVILCASGVGVGMFCFRRVLLVSLQYRFLGALRVPRCWRWLVGVVLVVLALVLVQRRFWAPTKGLSCSWKSVLIAQVVRVVCAGWTLNVQV